MEYFIKTMMEAKQYFADLQLEPIESAFVPSIDRLEQVGKLTQIEEINKMIVYKSL